MFKIVGLNFLSQDIENYKENREYLPEVLTSQLSIYLAYGMIDIIQVFNDLLQNYDKMNKITKLLYVN